MATYNLAQENNEQNQSIITMLGGIFERQNTITTFLSLKIEKQTNKMVEMHNTECNKLDRMIALLEKIAGEGE